MERPRAHSDNTSSSIPPTISSQLALTQTGPDTYTSVHFPRRLGNAAPIAYGGCTAGLAVHAACLTVATAPRSFHLYSVLGAFHGPTRIDRPLVCAVTRTRATKTFQTRRVVASQTLDDGAVRTCADLFVDFHVVEDELVAYHAPPSMGLRYGSGPMDQACTREMAEVAERLVGAGHVRRETVEGSRLMVAMVSLLFLFSLFLFLLSRPVFVCLSFCPVLTAGGRRARDDSK